MKNIKLLSIFLSLVVVFTSCQEDDPTLGDIVAPSNLTLVADLLGADALNPNGDGSGFVTFTATADDEITYQFNFGDGNSDVNTSGTLTHRYTITGVNTFTVVVNAVGTGGVSSSTSIDIDVFSSFSDVDAENFLSGENVNDSKTWYWAADEPLHIGLGPFEDDYGNGEFAYQAWWSAILPFDAEKSCMYDNEFVFTRTANGLSFEQTVGPAYVPGAYASEIGVAAEQCYGDDVVTTMFGVKNVSFFPSSSKAALEGSYNDEPYRQTSFQISDGGFMGWYVGASTYDIISISEDRMIVRIIQAGSPYSDGGYAWYQVFKSSPPITSFVSAYNNLVWSDEFNVDGSPDPTNWGYDLGAGGWGNNEEQTYTNSSDNVTVEGGSLKITAKAETGGGYTSARLKSENLREYTYGRIEARAKLPEGGGTWPAIWMLGANFDTVGWPDCGEIDIMEHAGNNINTIHGTLHYPGNSGGDGDGNTTIVSGATTDFHLYSVEWTANTIKFIIDNELVYHTFTNESSTPFNSDFFLILNLAMGGDFGGAIDAAFSEATMEIDYIKVYQ